MNFGEKLLPILEKYKKLNIRHRSSQLVKKVGITTLALTTLTFSSAAAYRVGKRSANHLSCVHG